MTDENTTPEQTDDQVAPTTDEIVADGGAIENPAPIGSDDEPPEYVLPTPLVAGDEVPSGRLPEYASPEYGGAAYNAPAD